MKLFIISATIAILTAAVAHAEVHRIGQSNVVRCQDRQMTVNAIVMAEITSPGKASDASGNVAQIGHILLVTRSYPPLNLASSLRVYNWAKYWSRQGVRVTVLTTRKHRFFGPCDLDCPPLQNVRVVEVEFLPSLVIRLVKMLTGDPAVTVGGSQASAGPIRLVRVKRWLRRFRESSKLLPSVEFYDFWITKAARMGRSIVASEQVDALVSSFGPPASHSIAARLKRDFPSLVWVADYRDPWTFHEGYCLRGLNGYLERRREFATVGRHADLLVSVSRGLAEQSKLFVDRPVIVVENGFDPEEDVEAAIDPAGIPEHLRMLWAPTTLVYTGTLHVEYQDPRPLFRAVAKLVASDDRARKQLRVLFFGGRHDRLPPLIEAERIADHVYVVGHVNRYLAMCAQRRASALVLVEDQASAARGVLRAKMFEYLQAGRPILGVGFEPETEVGQIIQSAGAGKVCGSDVERIANCIRLLVHGDELDGWRPDPTFVDRFRRDHQASRLLAALSSLHPPQSCSGRDRLTPD